MKPIYRGKKMNHWLILLTTLLLATTGAWSQSSQIAKPTVLIDGKSGSGPGEYTIDTDANAPSSFVVDDNEQVFILDTLNNRVQHYDANGKWLAAIPIQSTEQTTEDERKKAPMLSENVQSVLRIDLLGGSIYAVLYVFSDFGNKFSLNQFAVLASVPILYA